MMDKATVHTQLGTKLVGSIIPLRNGAIGRVLNVHDMIITFEYTNGSIGTITIFEYGGNEFNDLRKKVLCTIYGKKCLKCGSSERLCLSKTDKKRSKKSLEHVPLLCHECNQKRDVFNEEFVDLRPFKPSDIFKLGKYIRLEQK